MKRTRLKMRGTSETREEYLKNYRATHLKERKRYNKKYRLKNKERIKEYLKVWKSGNKEHILKYQKKWYRNRTPQTRAEHYEKDRIRRYNLRTEVLCYYGGSPPRCGCCGEKEVLFLTLDHINNDGAKHRKELRTSTGKMAAGTRTYRWAKENNFPAMFQVLCCNCNFAKWRNKGVCPHKNYEKK